MEKNIEINSGTAVFAGMIVKSQGFLESCAWQKLKDQCSDHITNSIFFWHPLSQLLCFSSWCVSTAPHLIIISHTLYSSYKSLFGRQMTDRWSNIIFCSFHPKAERLFEKKNLRILRESGVFSCQGGQRSYGWTCQNRLWREEDSVPKIELYSSFFIFSI